MSHLADENLRDVLAFERRRAREQLAQSVELALARMTSLDRRDLRKFFVELANCQRRIGVGAAQLERHLDGFSEIFGGGEDVLALVGAVGHLGDDFPDCAAADLQALLLALLDRAPDHESRGDFGFIEVERGEERADLFGHLQPALSLAERLADDREIVKRGHVDMLGIEANHRQADHREMTIGPRTAGRCGADRLRSRHYGESEGQQPYPSRDGDDRSLRLAIGCAFTNGRKLSEFRGRRT